MARWNSCLKQIVTTRLFGLGIAIIVLPLSAIKNQKPCKLSLKTEAKSVLKANKYSQITMQNGDRYPTKATDIKAFVDTCRLGLTCFLTGEGVTPIAGMASEYTIGLVLKRGEDSAAVMIFAYSVREVYCLFKNGTWDTAITKL